MNLYFYGGSFDPPHLGHKEIINYFLDRCNQLLIIPSFQSPLKSYTPVSYYHRKRMLEMMFEKISSRLEVIDYENDNKIKYSFETVKFLKDEYPNYILNMILGVDQFNVINSRKNHEYILSNVNLLVISRPGHGCHSNSDNITFFDNISIDSSSQFIKNNINDLDRIEHMLDKKVLKYIIKNNLYV